MKNKLSIIIPVKDIDSSKRLCNQLKTFNDCEIILASKGSRAESMNKAVQKSTGNILWFLHADSIINEKSINKIKSLLKTNINNLYYFDLIFSTKNILMRLNEIGVYLRCRIFKLPFGDQGFIISKQNFTCVGGYDQNCKYGEDHLLIWDLKNKNIGIKPIGAFLKTSPEKYIKGGWLKTTLKHQKLFYKQVYSQLRKKL